MLARVFEQVSTYGNSAINIMCSEHSFLEWEKDQLKDFLSNINDKVIDSFAKEPTISVLQKIIDQYHGASG